MCLPGLFGGVQQAPPPPPPPPPPAPPPAPPTQDQVSSGQASTRQRLQAASETAGRGGTILTGPQGLTDEDEAQSQKTLLGN